MRTQVGGGLVRTRGSRSRWCWAGRTTRELAQWRDILLAKMAENPGFIGADSDYKETRPQMRVVVDRARGGPGVHHGGGHRAGDDDGGRRVTTFVDNGEEYDVIAAGRPRRPRRWRPGNLQVQRARQPGASVEPGQR